MRLLLQLAQLLFRLWLLATAVFICLYALPGDPARLILGPQASSEAVSQFRVQAGLEKPLGQQYLQYLGRLTRLDFGNSWLYRRSVLMLLAERGGNTLKLAVSATGVVVTVSLLIPLLLRWSGATALLGILDAVLSIFASVPPYLLGVLALALFAGWLGWMRVLFDPSHLSSWLVPALVLAAYPTALIFRLFDDGLRRELSSAYCQRARAFGLPASHILLREALPNSLPAVLAGAANSLAFFVTGAFFVEATFGIPGWGRLAQEAIRNQDLALLGPLCLIFTAIISALMQAADWSQHALNPKFRHSHEI
jgi:peptide/nickel transport system permease protein